MADRPYSNAHIIHEQTLSFTPINSKVALFNRLPIPCMGSVNNSNTADVRITTSTLWAFCIDFHMFSLIQTELNENYISNVTENITCVF